MRIAIIGCGPAGCFAALNFLSLGYDAIKIFEKRENIFNPKVRCSGLISISGINRIGFPLKKSVILNEVRGAKLYSPSGIEVEIDAKKEKAYVLDRRAFDVYLLEKLLSKNVEIEKKNIRARDLRKILAENSKVVIATGTNYLLHNSLGLDKPWDFLIGAQYELKLETDPDFVELYFNVKDFFSWVIPVDESTARVGVCTRGDAISYLKKFVKKLERDSRLKSKKILDRHYGVIPIHDPKIRTEYSFKDSEILLLGDAASQVKASTGGGIIMTGIAAKYVAENYERKWRGEIGKELKLHLMIHNFLRKLSDKNKDRLFLLLRGNEHLLEKNGDMDFASKTLVALAKSPKFLMRFVKEIPNFAFDLLS